MKEEDEEGVMDVVETDPSDKSATLSVFLRFGLERSAKTHRLNPRPPVNNNIARKFQDDKICSLALVVFRCDKAPQ